MNQPEQPIITLLAEGGSIILFKTNETFYFYTSEIMDDEEDFKVKKVPQSFPSFSEAFIALQNKYPIFNLYLDEVHTTYVSELKELLSNQTNIIEDSNPSWLDFLRTN
jgi:hypothetical protein